MTPPTDDAEPQRPLLRVIHGGEPTAEETAALVGVVTLLNARAADRPEPAPSQWASRRAALRRPLHPGPGAWVAGSRPS